MKKYRHAVAVGSILLGTGIVWTGCPKPLPPVEDPKPPPAKDGAFVAGVFQESIKLGIKGLTAFGEKPEMFVGRFDSNGRTAWLKAFPTVASGRGVSFITDNERITVMGVFDEALDIDGRVLKTTDLPGRAAGTNGLFFAVFDGKGQVMEAKVLAAGKLLATPDLERAGKDIRVVVRTMGGFEVPGHNASGDGEQLVLLVRRDGSIVEVKRMTVQTPPMPKFLKGAPAKKAMLEDREPVSGYMLTAQLAAGGSCDYCAAGNAPLWDENCSSCVGTVMNLKLDCWGSEWNWECMQLARDNCPGPKKCVCHHQTCTAGSPMQRFCTEGGPTTRPPCVNTVGGRIFNCYRSGWDSSCNNESMSNCVPRTPPPSCF